MKFGKFGTLEAGIAIANKQGEYPPLSRVIGDDYNRTYRLVLPVLKQQGTFDEEGNYHESPVMLPDDQFQVIASNVVGYKADFNVFGSSMLPCKDAYPGENDKIIDPNHIGDLVPIANILYDAAYKRDCDRKETELKIEAEKMGTELNPATLKEALHKIETEYYGEKVNDVNVPPSKQRIINTMGINNYTAGKIYRLMKDGTIDKEFGLRNCIIPVSNKKSQQLILAVSKAAEERATMLNKIAVKRAANQPLTEAEENYKHMLDMGFIEVEYAYNGNSKKEAGQNANFVYCAEANDAVMTKFPNFWQEHKKDFTEGLLRDDAQIDNKNITFVKAITPAQIRAAFQKYCAENAVLGSYVDFEEDKDRIKRSAAAMLNIIGFKQNVKFYTQLQELSSTSDDVPEVIDKEMEKKEEKMGSILKAREEAGRTLTIDETLAAAGGDIDALAADLPEEL